MSVSRVLVSCFLCLMVPNATFAQETCALLVGWRDTLTEKKSDGTESVSERVYGICVDTKLRDELIATIKQSRQLSDESLAILRNGIRNGTVVVRAVSAGVNDLGSDTISKGKAAARSTADLSTEALSQLAMGARWVWQLYDSPTVAPTETPSKE
jgi:hypothetical protein